MALSLASNVSHIYWVILYESFSADKRKHLAEIASLKKQIAGEQTFSAELEEEHKKVSWFWKTYFTYLSKN